MGAVYQLLRVLLMRELISSLLFTLVIMVVTIGVSLSVYTLVVWEFPDINEGWRFLFTMFTGFSMYVGYKTHGLNWRKKA